MFSAVVLFIVLVLVAVFLCALSVNPLRGLPSLWQRMKPWIVADFRDLPLPKVALEEKPTQSVLDWAAEEAEKEDSTIREILHLEESRVVACVEELQRMQKQTRLCFGGRGVFGMNLELISAIMLLSVAFAFAMNFSRGEGGARLPVVFVTGSVVLLGVLISLLMPFARRTMRQLLGALFGLLVTVVVSALFAGLSPFQDLESILAALIAIVGFSWLASVVLESAFRRRETRIGELRARLQFLSVLQLGID